MESGSARCRKKERERERRCDNDGKPRASLQRSGLTSCERSWLVRGTGTGPSLQERGRTEVHFLAATHRNGVFLCHENAAFCNLHSLICLVHMVLLRVVDLQRPEQVNGGYISYWTRLIAHPSTLHTMQRGKPFYQHV